MIAGNYNLSGARFRFQGSPNNVVATVAGIGHFNEMVGGFNILGQQVGGSLQPRTTLAFHVPENWVYSPEGSGNGAFNIVGQWVQNIFNPDAFNVLNLIGSYISRVPSVQFARKQRQFNIVDAGGVFQEHQDALPQKRIVDDRRSI